VISAAALTRRFGPRIAVRDVSFEVGRGEIVALLGPNGAGKTTTLRMLAGLIAPTSGSVTIDGLSFSPSTAKALRRRIGFLTESPGLWDRLTVRENLEIYAGLFAVDAAGPRIERWLDALELSAHQSTRAAELSKGMRQKVAIVRALLHEPRVLLLDEPTSSLDPEITRAVRTLLTERRDAGCAVLVSTHNLDEAERIADRVAVLQQTLVAIDTPASLRRRLTRGRVRIRLAGEAGGYLDAVRAIDPAATAERHALSVAVREMERDTPLIVNALVSAGASIVEVRPDMPALEDVYLHLVADAAAGVRGRAS
jgi:ABC-2 type transport system ATP-binding protein